MNIEYKNIQMTHDTLWCLVIAIVVIIVVIMLLHSCGCRTIGGKRRLLGSVEGQENVTAPMSDGRAPGTRRRLHGPEIERRLQSLPGRGSGRRPDRRHVYRRRDCEIINNLVDDFYWEDVLDDEAWDSLLLKRDQACN